MKLRGIKLVEARNFKHTIVDNILTCSCTGNGCTEKATVAIENYTVEDLILECKYKLADEIDTIYETKYLYPEGDYGAMLESVYNVIEVSGSIEASNWLRSETDGGSIVSCCANHGDKHYSHLEDAINSICVWPDREYHEQVYWKDQK